MNPLLIAEVKTMSPFGFRSRTPFLYLFKMANMIGDMLSIHTNPKWGGSMRILEGVRGMTDKRILAKGIHETDKEVEQALNLGADYVLVVGRLPDRSLRKYVMYEPLSLDQLKDAPQGMKVVWNSRDLLTGGFKKETFAAARQQYAGWLCQASNIGHITDIDPTADAFIVGQKLPELFRTIAPRVLRSLVRA